MICYESKHFKIIHQLKKHNYSLSNLPNQALNLAKNLYFLLKNAFFTVCVGTCFFFWLRKCWRPKNQKNQFCATIFFLVKISLEYLRMTCNIANRLSLFKEFFENIDKKDKRCKCNIFSDSILSEVKFPSKQIENHIFSIIKDLVTKICGLIPL